jgi:Bacterial HORMA domain family 1
MTLTRTVTATYTAVDIENVARRVKADLIMIADSTGVWTPAEAADYAHDIEELAKAGYLAWVDVTLFSYGVEQKAVRFEVNTNAGSWTPSRPGGVCWPKRPGAQLRIVLGYKNTYSNTAREAMRGKLRIGWVTSYDDTNHSGLMSAGGRDYASNGYGMARKDWAA